MNCLESDKTVNLEIWGRELPIRLVADVFPCEAIAPAQQEAYERFWEKKDAIFEEARAHFKGYCLANFGDKVDGEFKNIFSYILPKSLYFKRTKNGARVVGIFCKFRFDRENDLVAYVENETVKEIGTQDIIL